MSESSHMNIVFKTKYGANAIYGIQRPARGCIRAATKYSMDDHVQELEIISERRLCSSSVGS